MSFFSGLANAIAANAPNNSLQTAENRTVSSSVKTQTQVNSSAKPTTTQHAVLDWDGWDEQATTGQCAASSGVLKTNALSSSSDYDALLTQKSAIITQLKQLALVLHDQSSPEVRELYSQLQLDKTRQQTIMQHAQQRLAEISPQLAALNQGAEAILLEAISQQAWYAFKNGREVIFDSRTGLLFPNFEYVPHIKCSDWQKEQKNFAPNGVGQRSWMALHEFIDGFKDERTKDFLIESYYSYGTDFNPFGGESNSSYGNFPLKYAGGTKKEVIVHVKSDSSYPYQCFTNFFKNGSYDGRNNVSSIENRCLFPINPIFFHPDIQKNAVHAKATEKAKIILGFFIQQNWIPLFEPFLDKNDNEDDDDYQDRVAAKQCECDEYNSLFDAYYQRIQLERQLVAIEQKLETLPPPTPDNPFTAAFDYRQALHEQQYDLNKINQSVWQYSQAVQTWVRFLLTQLDDITQRQQPLLAQAAELKHALTAKPISSKHLTDTELQLLQARHHDLQQRLDFGIEPVRAALFSVLQQAQTLQNQLQQAHQYPDSLMRLAELERQPRPSFNLVAEHTATLCTQALTKLEWLEQSLEFVQAIVQSEQQHTESYLVLLDKYQADLLQQGTANSIEASDVQQWFTEWRQQHLIAQQQWQPLVQAGLEHALPPQAVLDTLQAMQHYQQAVDQFYLGERLGIHTTYAFQANGHRQEKLEKEQKLTELRHKLMQQLEAVIFALPSSVEKIWLVRWVEVWQQGLVQAITDLLQHEQLIERDDIVQIMLEDMRKVQQQNLAACLQDAKSYSQALAMREKDTATLIFKMRKALMK